MVMKVQGKRYTRNPYECRIETMYEACKVKGNNWHASIEGEYEILEK